MQVLVIDNYDSFTYNLVHYLGELGAKATVRRNDKISLDEIAKMAPEAIVLSPGPGVPSTAGICIDLVKRFCTKIPILGVCLGHQAIGEAFGGDIIGADELMHGKTSPIRHSGKGVFENLDPVFEATRYHSLIIDRTTLPQNLEVTAETGKNMIMGVRHTKYPVHGVQFHPESIASQNGHALLKNFLDLAKTFNAARAA